MKEFRRVASTKNLHGNNKIYALIKHGVREPGMSDSKDGATPDYDTDMYPLFHRLGLIRGKRVCNASSGKIQGIINDIATSSGDDPGDVKGTIRRFCNDTCGDTPLCEQCTLTGLCTHFKKRPSIKQLPEDERPRERLIKGGEEWLTDAELLGIIIRDGTPEYSAVDLARRLLTKFGDFRELSTKSIGEMCKVHGIGPAKATQIKATMAIARRFSTLSLKSGNQFQSSRAIFSHFHEQLRDKKQETFLVVLLDGKQRIIKDKTVSTGSLLHSFVHPRDVFKPAIKESASSVVFVHNHPSGDPTPSDEDVELTQRLKEASLIVGINIVDHVVIGNDRYYSFKDEGRL